jgi:hypothetical protein
MVLGRIPGLTEPEEVEVDGRLLRPINFAPADAGFCDGFYRSMNTMYEPAWSKLLPGVIFVDGHSQDKFSGKLDDRQLATMILHCYTLEDLERRIYGNPEHERHRLAQIEKYRKGLPPFPGMELGSFGKSHLQPNRMMDETTASVEFESTSMSNIELFLNTSPESFAQWLGHHTASVYLQHFPTELGRIVLQRAGWNITRGGQTFVEMQGDYITPNADGKSETFTA